MKIRLDNKDSKVVKENDTYRLLDNTSLNNLVVSKTILHPDKCTNGHDHVGQEEVYQFVSGHGTMRVGDDTFPVFPNDTVLIPEGAFHKVWNTSEMQDLVFVCVFDGKRNH